MCLATLGYFSLVIYPLNGYFAAYGILVDVINSLINDTVSLFQKERKDLVPDIGYTNAYLLPLAGDRQERSLET